MKDILNNRVKHREPFRPFAPTVTEEDQFEYFDLKCSSKYMLLATTVKEEYRKKLSAITHIDNTARIQAISKDEDPFLHALLLELKRINGFPIVLNTSFNVAGQPIVETPLDAINTFLTTDIDILVIGNFIIDKKTMSNNKKSCFIISKNIFRLFFNKKHFLFFRSHILITYFIYLQRFVRYF